MLNTHPIKVSTEFRNPAALAEEFQGAKEGASKAPFDLTPNPHRRTPPMGTPSRFSLLLIPLVALFLVLPAGAGTPAKTPSREETLAAARELMTSCHYTALCTVAADGGPRVRTMNPFPPEADMSVWMATSDKTLKVQELRANPKVTLFYGDLTRMEGYVALRGKAVLVTDPAEIRRRHRAYWDQAFPGGRNLVLIHVVPERLEVISYKHGLNNDPVAWAAPAVTFPPS